MTPLEIIEYALAALVQRLSAAQRQLEELNHTQRRVLDEIEYCTRATRSLEILKNDQQLRPLPEREDD